MTPDDLLRRAGEQLGVRRVFGEPVEREGTLVIPVAVAIGGGGGGTAPAEPGGEGGGFGGIVRAVGVFSVRDGQVRFVPAIDVTALALAAVLLVRVVSRSRRRCDRCHGTADRAATGLARGWVRRHHRPGRRAP